MFAKLGLFALGFLILSAPIKANAADGVVVDGDLRISGVGTLVFPDGSIQNSASVQGPKGDPGVMGPSGPPGFVGPAYAAMNYYALGDSITYGAGSASGSYSYVDILQANFNFSASTKLAVGGATAMSTAGRSELASQVNAIGTGADIITVMIGVNDFLVGNPLGDTDAVLQKQYDNLGISLSFAEAFRYCLETIKRNHEQARIYVILPIQTMGEGSGSVTMDQYRTAEIKIANYLSIPIIAANTESGLWARGTLMPDGLHPNDAGYRLLGHYISRKMLSL